ncbi:ABC transporter ATP-binding protein, partial [Gordonia amicalis]|nr:ABC transporter ATP-binding protein [Gordonia amicalis]
MLTELRDEGMTLLLVSHFKDEAEHLCDRLAVIDRGRVIALDTPERLASTVATAQTLHFVTSGAVYPYMLRALPSVSRVDT